MNEDGNGNLGVVKVLEFRAREFPELQLDMGDLGGALVGMFEALDDKYAELFNNHTELQKQMGMLQRIKEEYEIVIKQKSEVYEENMRMRKEMEQLESRKGELEESNEMNKNKIRQLEANRAEREKLIVLQSSELAELSEKFADLQSLKYQLQQKIKEESEQKQLIQVSLSRQIADIQVVRERQKTHIKDVAKEIKEYYEEVNLLRAQKISLTKAEKESQKELQEIRMQCSELKNSNNYLELKIAELCAKCQELELMSKELQSKEQELQDMKVQNSNLKEKEGNLDLLVQNLSSQKNKLNLQINRITVEARANRKRSDQSINTDTAFEHMTQSFKYHCHPEDNLNKSFQSHAGDVRRMSMSESFKVNRSYLQVEAVSAEAEKIAELQNRNNELQRTVRRLRQLLKTREEANETPCSNVISSLDENVLVVDMNQLSLSDDQIKEQPLSIHKFNLTVKPSITLLSLYSLPATKLLPKPKISTSIQTIQKSSSKTVTQKHMSSQMDLSFEGIEIPRKMSPPKQESFFDKLSKMFCGSH